MENPDDQKEFDDALKEKDAEKALQMIFEMRNKGLDEEADNAGERMSNQDWYCYECWGRGYTYKSPGTVDENTGETVHMGGEPKVKVTCAVCQK